MTVDLVLASALWCITRRLRVRAPSGRTVALGRPQASPLAAGASTAVEGGGQCMRLLPSLPSSSVGISSVLSDAQAAGQAGAGGPAGAGESASGPTAGPTAGVPRPAAGRVGGARGAPGAAFAVPVHNTHTVIRFAAGVRMATHSTGKKYGSLSLLTMCRLFPSVCTSGPNCSSCMICCMCNKDSQHGLLNFRCYQVQRRAGR